MLQPPGTAIPVLLTQVWQCLYLFVVGQKQVSRLQVQDQKQLLQTQQQRQLQEQQQLWQAQQQQVMQ